VRIAVNGSVIQKQNVENAIYQLFITDPVGTMLEFNFPNDEAPNAVVLRVETPASL